MFLEPRFLMRGVLAGAKGSRRCRQTLEPATAYPANPLTRMRPFRLSGANKRTMKTTFEVVLCGGCARQHEESGLLRWPGRGPRGRELGAPAGWQVGVLPLVGHRIIQHAGVVCLALILLHVSRQPDVGKGQGGPRPRVGSDSGLDSAACDLSGAGRFHSGW